MQLVLDFFAYICLERELFFLGGMRFSVADFSFDCPLALESPSERVDLCNLPTDLACRIGLGVNVQIRAIAFHECDEVGDGHIRNIVIGKCALASIAVLPLDHSTHGACGFSECKQRRKDVSALLCAALVNVRLGYAFQIPTLEFVL